MKEKENEINQILEKARHIIEGQPKRLLTEEEEKILEKRGGVVFLAYKKAKEYLNNKEEGEKTDERAR